MKNFTNGMGKSPLLAATVLICGLLFAGCDEHLEVTRDPGIPVHKGSTWAWRPMAAPRDGDRRPVVSRDVISRRETIARDPYGSNDMVRERVRIAIEETLTSKGLRQVSDPRDADFLVEYHLAVRKHDVTLQRVSTRIPIRESFADRMDVGNPGAGVRRPSVTRMSGTAKGPLCLTSWSSRRGGWRTARSARSRSIATPSVKTRLPSSSITCWGS